MYSGLLHYQQCALRSHNVHRGISQKKDQQMNDLSNKVAIVTGACTGAAARIAQAYAVQGAMVVVNYSTRKEAAQSVVASIVDAGGQAVAIQADVSRIEEVRRLFDRTEALFGRPDIVVNSAGCNALHRQSNGANLFCQLLVTGEAVRRFGLGGGSIINIAALEDQDAVSSGSVYVSAEGPIDPISLGLSRTLKSRGIRVNAIAMAAAKREFAVIGAGAGQACNDASESIKRVADAEDNVAQMAVFLASQKASYLSGECIIMPDSA